MKKLIFPYYLSCKHNGMITIQGNLLPERNDRIKIPEIPL